MKKIIFISICTLNMFLLSSCTLYSKPKVPALNNPNYFKPQIKMTSANLNNNWWENFNDPELNQLVNSAIKNNYSYQIALKNIDIACTYVTQNMASLFPQANMGFNTSRNKSAAAISNVQNVNTFNPTSSGFSQIFNLQQLTGTITYQVDIWNQIRNSVKQAQANQAVTEADSNNVKLTVISSVVSTYFQIKALNGNIINLNKQLQTSEEIVQLYNTQFSSGLIDFSTVDTAKNQVEVLKTNIDSLEKQQQVLQNTLAYLSGQYPENFTVKIDNGLNNFHNINLIPSGIPAKMIANRPDIQDAYYQILSYGYLVKQTIANFLPSVNLTANYGYASTALSNLLAHSNAYWNYGLYSTQFVFDYGTRMSEYKRANYQYQSAILTYKNTVINAFNQVDSNLSSYQEDNEALNGYQNQVANSKDLLMIANAQYQSGLNDYTNYLIDNLSYLQNDYNLTNQKLAVIQDIIQVYVSLGLGL